jgi:hypothetical protein
MSRVYTGTRPGTVSRTVSRWERETLKVLEEMGRLRSEMKLFGMTSKEVSRLFAEARAVVERSGGLVKFLDAAQTLLDKRKRGEG